MKKSKLLVCAVLASCFLSAVSAQEKVYFSENFSDGKINSTKWNVSESTNIPSASGPIYIVGFSDGSIYGGWAYDPNGQMLSDQSGKPVATSKLDGTYTFVSQPYTLEAADKENILTFDYFYSAASISTGKSFGIMARSEGNAWDTIYRLWQPGSSVSTSGDGSLNVTLPDSFSSKKVEIAFFLDNTDEVYFGLFFGNIQFAAWESKTSAKIEFLPEPITPMNSLANLKLTNNGTAAIESISMAIELNGKYDTADIKLDQALPMTKSTTESLTLNTEGLETGKDYTVSLWPVQINSEEYSQPDTIRWTFLYSDTNSLSNMLPVMEVFTANWCAPCRVMNSYLNPTLEKLREMKAINMMKFQMSPDKYSISDGEKRYMYYYDMAGGSVPAPIFHASSNMLKWPAETYNDLMEKLEKDAVEMSKKKSLINMSIKNLTVDTITGAAKFDVEITAICDMSASLVTVVTEGTTKKNRGTNGETEFHWVAMTLPGGDAGEKFDIKAGELKTLSYEVDLSKTNMEEYKDMEVVAFVQNVDNRQIFQSTFFDFYEGEVESGSGAANEENNLMDGISIYPNPVRDNAHISGLENADIQMFDITGRVVYTQQGVSGDMEISTDNFRAGNYLLRITQKGETKTHKISIVK